jgi:hypothetical protein
MKQLNEMTKAEQRKAIAQDTADFLKMGGKIQKIETGKTKEKKQDKKINNEHLLTSRLQDAMPRPAPVMAGHQGREYTGATVPALMGHEKKQGAA